MGLSVTQWWQRVVDHFGVFVVACPQFFRGVFLALFCSVPSTLDSFSLITEQTRLFAAS